MNYSLLDSQGSPISVGDTVGIWGRYRGNPHKKFFIPGTEFWFREAKVVSIGRVNVKVSYFVPNFKGDFEPTAITEYRYMKPDRCLVIKDSNDYEIWIEIKRSLHYDC